MKKTFIYLAIVFLHFTAISQENFVKNQVIVMMHGKFNIENVIPQFNSSTSELHLSIDRILSNRAHVYLLEFNESKFSVPDVVQILRTDDRIAFAQPNHTNVKQRNTIPNDLEYPVQWSLGSSASARIFAPEAWDISTDGVTHTGDTIVMAVVDGGVDLDHIDLNLFKNKHEIPNNGIDDDNNGYIDDYDGWSAYTQSGVIENDPHGTHIAGIMGARTNNSEGVAGIVWGGKVIPINASSHLESVVIEGYGYALELRSKYNETNGDSGAFIVVTNSSFGIDLGQPADYPIWCAFYDSLGAAGILNMGATSNSGIDVDSLGDVPTTCPSNFLVSVANINENGNLIGGYGATEIELAAPGTDIRSTIPNHDYGFKTGTSMATPHVAGVVGAMYSAMCGFDLEDALTRPDSLTLWVKQKLLESVDTVPNLIDKTNTSGRLNMFKALNAVQTGAISLTYNTTPASNSSTSDGAIELNLSGGTPPYSFIWNTGDTTQNLINIPTDNYFVTVTESFGCETNQMIELWTVGISELDTQNPFVLAPNPSNGDFQIQFEKENTVPLMMNIYTNIGKLVYQTEIPRQTSNYAVSAKLATGMYFIKIENYSPIKLLVY